ncbi:hypothetical protein JOF56_007211 [Kibdelosporangium banguiense]|uniref:Lipoprotein n=2 Tax=Kibdelosporangium banguiense TaxID=1365924 RepID=A0ABS4TQY9_9PSEU|nr:hypothetical protein [Kibdelosporangium banguiense]
MLLLAGCGDSSETATVREVTTRFESAMVSHDSSTACSLLAPEAVRRIDGLRPEGCVQALSSLKIPSAPPGDTQVWGDTAQVRTSADTLFLRRFPGGWRIIGAGCTPRGEQPYECTVDGT